jgi:hypothetical protein
VDLYVRDREAGELSVATTTDFSNLRPALRSHWKTHFGQALPPDLPHPVLDSTGAVQRMGEYVEDTDWNAVRARGAEDPDLGLDPAFWDTVQRVCLRDFDTALAVWDAHVPKDIPLPGLLDPAVRAGTTANMQQYDRSLAPNAERTDGTDGGAGMSVNAIERDRKQAHTAAASPPTAVSRPDGVASDRPPLPSFINRHFVEKEGHFYYRQWPDRLAFTDRGDALRAEDDSLQVAKALVEIATARQWTALRVRGSEAFRRAVWLAAAERGIEVSGYRPKAGELALLAQRRGLRPESPSENRPESSRIEGRDRPMNRLAGQVLAYGKAPYRNEADGSPSYYVSLRNADGEVATHWGIDLERVMGDAGVQVGDAVELKQLGRQRVRVREPVKDAVGQTVDWRIKETERNAWSVTVGRQSTEADRALTRATDDPRLMKAVAFFEKRFAALPEDQMLEVRERFRRLFDQSYGQVATEKAAKEGVAVPLAAEQWRRESARSGTGLER